MAMKREPLTFRKIVGGKGGLILSLVCGFLAALCIGIGFTNLRTAQRSLDWPSTSGEVVRAEVEEHVDVSKDREGSGTKTTVTHESNVVYVYRVAEQEYRGQRVRFDWEMDRAEAEATVAKYPVGQTVSVYYDPDDPSDAVLEPGGNVYVYEVLIGLGVFFVAIPAVWFAIRALVLSFLPGFRIRIDKNMASRVDEAKGWRAKWAACNWIQKTAVVTLFPILGAALLGWMALSFSIFYAGMEGYLSPDGARNWPETSGLVVTSELKPILVKRSGDEGAATYYRYDLAIAIEYRVLTSRYILEKNTSIVRDEDEARATLARFPKGRYVSVYYDPNDPSAAELTPHEPAGIGSAVLGGLMMAPWLFAGAMLGWLWLKKRYLSPSRPAGAA
jgi:hypothetical protein